MSLLLSKRCFHVRINLGRLLKWWVSYCWSEYVSVLTGKNKVQKFNFKVKDYWTGVPIPPSHNCKIKKLLPKKTCLFTNLPTDLRVLIQFLTMMPPSWCTTPQHVSYQRRSHHSTVCCFFNTCIITNQSPGNYIYILLICNSKYILRGT